MATISYAINGLGILGREIFRQGLNSHINNGGNMPLVVNDPNMTSSQFIYLIKNDTVYYGNSIKQDFTIQDMGTSTDANGYSFNQLVFTENGHTYNVYFYSLNTIQDFYIASSDYGVNFAIDCYGTLSASDMTSYSNYGFNGVLLIGDYVSTTISYFVPILYDGFNKGDVKIMPLSETQICADILDFINNNYGVDYCYFTNTRSYTNIQKTQDSATNSSNMQLGRSGSWNIVPYDHYNTYRPIGYISPALNGKVRGYEYRVPVVNCGIIDMYVTLSKSSKPDDIMSDLKHYEPSIIGYSTEQLCSSDVCGTKTLGTVLSKYSDSGASSYDKISIKVAYDPISGLAQQAVYAANKYAD